MQDDLFSTPEPAPPNPSRTEAAPVPARKRGADVVPATHDAPLRELAARLPEQLSLGTSSWYFPGWKGLVWDGEHSEATLSKKGLSAYSQHPLLKTVSLDRVFYRPMTSMQYAGVAAQVPEGFRFVVKAPSLVADAVVRGEDGRGMQSNPAFLDPKLALDEFVQPALEGLGSRIGALVFQLSPLPPSMAGDVDAVLQKLDRMLSALPRIDQLVPGAVIAVEVRNASLLTPAFVQVLKSHGATYCLGLHAKMPPIEEQLPVLRALWPAPLVCRWSLHRKHGAFGYEEAKGIYDPFDRMVDPDPDTRDVLARVIVATVAAGYRAYVTINNKAEGSAPLSVQALANAVLEKLGANQTERSETERLDGA